MSDQESVSNPSGDVGQTWQTHISEIKTSGIGWTCLKNEL